MNNPASQTSKSNTILGGHNRTETFLAETCRVRLRDTLLHHILPLRLLLLIDLVLRHLHRMVTTNRREGTETLMKRMQGDINLTRVTKRVTTHDSSLSTEEASDSPVTTGNRTFQDLETHLPLDLPDTRRQLHIQNSLCLPTRRILLHQLLLLSSPLTVDFLLSQQPTKRDSGEGIWHTQILCEQPRPLHLAWTI